jgi:S1-C subfamily serine protease
VEVNGTVISPTGLTVTSLFVVDPQSQMEGLRAQQGGRGPELVGSDFKEVKLRFADGKEVPAKFVLKDADLDLAFIAPETPEPDRVYPHINLAEGATGVLLGNYYSVSRHTKAMQRTPVVRRTEIMAIVEKPRRIFLLTDQSLATPVFDPEGKVLGISLQYFANSRPSGYVVMPAGDIADMAKQAAEKNAAK